MPVIINGSTGISGTDGSAGTPAVQGTDTNTGMFFPAADTIAFAEGGVEVMRINSDAQFVVSAGTVSLPSITATGDTNTGMFFPAADTIAFAEGGVEAMRLDSSGNVGIGTTTPDAKLQVSGASGAVQFRAGTDANGYFEINAFDNNPVYCVVGGANATQAVWGTQSNIPVIFFSNNAERMRITAGGEVYVAGTTDQGAFNLQCNGTGVWGAGAYTNGSDARIKEDVSPLTSGVDVVSRLNPVQFRYKSDWSRDTNLQPGFIAQELQTALADQPYAEGVVYQGPQYMSVAYQTLIPVLTKAIQEQQAQIEDLKARIATLEAR